MSLENYIAKRNKGDKAYIKNEFSSKKEIKDLFQVAKRDLIDSNNTKLSHDWQFGIAYNAALKLCTIPLRASGKRFSSGAHHYFTILSLPYCMGEKYNSTSNYLNRCRKKRNRLEYESIGGVGPDEVKELTSFVKDFQKEIEVWIYANHPDLM